MNNFPWDNLNIPSSKNEFTTLRVDPEFKWDFFWGLNYAGDYILILEHCSSLKPSKQLPKLKGITISIETKEQKSFLILQLNDSNQKDIFYILCNDIKESTSKATSEKEALSISINRSFRWHYLLKGSSDKLLSQEEQKGLIGELFVLENYFMSVFNCNESLKAWTGPLDHPKDFQINDTYVEVKTYINNPNPHIYISSAFQLEKQDHENLFLSVLELRNASSNQTESFSLNDVVNELRNKINEIDPNCDELYESLLYASGYRFEDDYSAYKWILGDLKIYHVQDTFPRIETANLKLGITNVRYSLRLSDCEKFLVSQESLILAMESNKDA